MAETEAHSAAAPAAEGADEGLVRGLGPLEATTIIVGGVIGSGIFQAPSAIASNVGSPGMSLLVWLVCGLLALCGGLCIAELGAMLPRTGGQYVYIREAYRRRWVTFIYGWSAFWLVWPVSIAAVANVFANYLASVVNIITADTGGQGIVLGDGARTVIASACVLVLMTINVIGVRWSGRVTNLFTFIKIAALGGLILLGLFMAEKGSMAHFSPLFGGGGAAVGGFALGAFGAAMVTGLFSYEGWTFSSYVAGEMRDPRRNLPLSIIVGILFVIVIYIAANFVYILVLPFEQVQTSQWIAADVMKVLVGDWGALFISMGVMCSTFGGVNVHMLVAPRLFFAQSRDGLFFKGLSRAHPRFRTPAASILAQGILAALIALTPSFEEIISYGSFTSYAFSILAIAAVIVLRFTRPDARRPYRTWGYPVTPLLFLAVITGYLVSLLTNVEFIYNTLIGLAIVAAGFPFYFYWEKKNQGN
ncbi:MAG: amino acid permease [Gemmatimonadetes bacterium]|nr:amino acid permease [Gemmatimonadota bacterium]